jgi:hypothetical protein
MRQGTVSAVSYRAAWRGDPGFSGVGGERPRRIVCARLGVLGLGLELYLAVSHDDVEVDLLAPEFLA